MIGELDVIPPRIAIEAWVWSVEMSESLDIGLDALLPLIIPSDVGSDVAFALLGDPVPLIATGASTVPPFVARFTRRPFLVPIVGSTANRRRSPCRAAPRR